MAGSILKWWFSKNRCFFTRWIQRNTSEKTISSCSLTPRPFFALVGTATLLKRQNAIIPKRIRHERDPFFLCKKCDQASRCRSQTHFRTSTRNLHVSLKDWISIVFLHAEWINFMHFCKNIQRQQARWPLRAISEIRAKWGSEVASRTSLHARVRTTLVSKGKLPQIIYYIYYILYVLC